MSRRSVSRELEKRTFVYGDKHLKLSKKVNPKIEPGQVDTTNEQDFAQDPKLGRMYSVWIWLRQHYGLSGYNSINNQTVPSFAGN